jgi:hypothetical protein
MKHRRFTQEEDDIIRAEYADYVDVRATGIKLGRDYGTMRQRILHLGLTRDGSVSRMLKWCPEHLKPVLKEKGSEAFIESVNRHIAEAEQNEIKLSVEEKVEIDAQVAEIESRLELERREKMLAMRALGLPLESIGTRFGISRERVRQLIAPDFIRVAPRTGTVDNLIAVNARLEAKIADNKRRIKEKTLDALKSCWSALDDDARDEFITHIKSKK